MQNTIKELIEISHYAGNRVDYTQGGGGNTSVKNEKEGIMLIKASGYKLKDITENNAFVAVNKKKIADYYNNVDLSVKKDYEKESAELSKSAVVAISGVPALRPSVEVGFHAILNKYVIHTHSVYANILTCCKEGEKIAEKLFNNADFGYIFMPYINPGFELTIAMKSKIAEYTNKTGKYPEVIFMKNHGLVVNSDYIKRVIAINTEVNEHIRMHFGLQDDFRCVTIKKCTQGLKSATPIVCNFIKTHTIDKKYLDGNPLYPDQLVYLNNVLAFEPEKIKIEKNGVIYKTDEGQALTLEETLAAYLYIMTIIEKNKLTLSVMNEKEVNFINNWEAEKYRRTVSGK